MKLDHVKTQKCVNHTELKESNNLHLKKHASSLLKSGICSSDMHLNDARLAIPLSFERKKI